MRLWASSHFLFQQLALLASCCLCPLQTLFQPKSFSSHSIQQIFDTRPNTVFKVTNWNLFWVIFFAEVESLLITDKDDLSIQQMARASGSNGITNDLALPVAQPNTSL